MQDGDELSSISKHSGIDKSKGTQEVKISFQVLLRIESFPGGTVPVADQRLEEVVGGSQVLSAPTSSSTQNSLDLPCGMHMTK